MASTLREFWLGRSDRERLALSTGIAAVLLGALVLFVLEPALAARARLDSSLPRLRAQVVDMRAGQHEIALLRKKLVAAPRSQDPLLAVKASAARAALGGPLARVDGLPGGRVVVSAAEVDFDRWLAWVESLQREFGVHLEACSLVALGAPGRVRLEATFAASGEPPRP